MTKKVLNPTLQAFADELAKEFVDNLNRNVLKEAETPVPLPKDLPPKKERIAIIEKDRAERELKAANHKINKTIH